MNSRLSHWCLFVLAISGFSVRTQFTQVHAHATLSAEPVIELKVSTDHPDGTYRVREVTTFAIEATRGGHLLHDGDFLCTFCSDGWKPRPTQVVNLKDGLVRVTEKLDEPGFLLLRDMR